jgi:peptide/nickel transport system permease protein
MSSATPTHTPPPSMGFMRRMFEGAGSNRAGIISLVFLLVILAFALFPDAIAPHDPYAQNLRERLIPPAWVEGGSLNHILGTDSLGRDVFSQIIAGTRVTLVIGFIAAGLEALIGVTLGVIAGFKGGKVGAVIMRWVDIQMGFPAALLILFIILLTGGGTYIIPVALAVNGWMIFARVTRVSVSQLTASGFVEAAVASGISQTRIVVRHILPHIFGTVLTIFLFEVPRIILAESTLSFIGLGVQPPDISWGLMIGSSRSLLQVAFYLSFFPGLFIMATVLAMNLFSTWLEPILDPHRRSRL